jgi:protein SCO1/2
LNARPIDLVRRRLCAAAAWAAAIGAAPACATDDGALSAQGRAPPVRADHGRVSPPVKVPDFPVWRSDGPVASLADLLQNRATALHLMFTGCSSICPIQGAIFERVQRLLPDQVAHGIQLLSLSIDPGGDTPAALRAWLSRFGARVGWSAVAPRVADLAGVLDVFGGGRDAVDDHATEVNLIDRSGSLVFRTPQLPSADAIADLLLRL